MHARDDARGLLLQRKDMHTQDEARRLLLQTCTRSGRPCTAISPLHELVLKAEHRPQKRFSIVGPVTCKDATTHQE